MISFHTFLALTLSGLTITLPQAVDRASSTAAYDTSTPVWIPTVERLDIVIPPPMHSARDVSPNVLGQPTPVSLEPDTRALRCPTRPVPPVTVSRRPAPAARGAWESP